MNTIFNIHIETRETVYLELFHSLLNEIEQNWQMDIPEAEQLQLSFWTSLKHYKQLKEHALTYGFANDAAEIEYFREVKPKFTCFIEFFVISSEATWFENNK